MMMNEEEEWVTLTVKEHERSRCVAKVLRVECEAATAKGDHYASVMKRVKLLVMLHSGEVECRSLICKCLPSQGSFRKQVKDWNFFGIEKRMFSEVLPAMQRIVERITPDADPINARFIGAQGTDRILLEDLKVLGYRIIGHRKGLDYDHCEVVLRVLAKYHALSAILIQEGEVSLEEFNKYYFDMKGIDNEKLIRNDFNVMAWIFENKFKGEGIQFVDRLKNVADKVAPNLKKISKRDDSRFNVILHGDCWYNNVMFKYNEEGKPVSAKLCDFQLAWYNSFGYDLNYFLWTSLHTDVRPRKPELLRLYHESLSRNLRIYGYDKEPPSLEELLAEVDRTALFGFVTSMAYLQFMMQPPTNLPDVDQLSKEIAEESETVSHVNKDKIEGEDYRRTIEYIIKEGATLGLI